MTFLAPAALFGVVLLAIPILAHLFKPRKMRQTPFSSLRWLKQTHQRLSRRIQWHQWLLFLMRAGCILLLVLALAKPLIGVGSANAPLDRVIVLDLSASMAYQHADGETSLEKGRRLAEMLLKNPTSGGRTSVVMAGVQPRVIVPMTKDASAALPLLHAIQSPAGDARLTAALPLLPSLLAQSASKQPVEIIFLTDNLPLRWRQGEIKEAQEKLSQPLRVKVADVGPGSASNAWIAGARLLERGGERLVRVDVACSGGANQERTVIMKGIPGYGEGSRVARPQPGKIVPVYFAIPAELMLTDQVAELRLDPPDALTSDDVYFLPLDNSWPMRLLVVEPDEGDRDGRGVGLYLTTALDSLGAATRPALEVTTRSVSKLTPGDIQKAEVIFLAGVPEISDVALVALKQKVRAGAGLVLFLGSDVKPAFYNQKLFKPQQPSEGLLPAPLKSNGDRAALAGPSALMSPRWDHPLLSGLDDPAAGGLAAADFRLFCRFDGDLGKRDTVLAWFASETPALIDHPLGAGRVIVCNFSANDAWTDLPTKNAYVPLLDRAVGYLATWKGRADFTVGQPVNLPLEDFQPSENVKVADPDGALHTPRLLARGSQTLLHLDEVAAPGVYHVQRTGVSNLSRPFVVNAGRADAGLGTMDDKTLIDWWSPSEVELFRYEEAAGQFAGAATSWGVWPALMLVAGALLLLETIYVHRLCPRVNPTIAQSVVHKTGIMKRVQES